MALLTPRPSLHAITLGALIFGVAFLTSLPLAQSRAQDPEQSYDVVQPEMFSDQLPADAKITEVHVFHDDAGIHGLRLHYQLSNGLFNMLPIRGTAIGQENTVVLEGGEQIREVIGTRDVGRRLRTLTLITDRGESGPFGTAPDEYPFRLTLGQNREFAGFQGYLGDVLRRVTLVSRVASGNTAAASIAAAAPANPAAPKGLAITDTSASRTPVFKGWHLQSREFTCQNNGSEGDNTAEVFGNLTLSYDTGEGVRSVFLMSLAKQYAVAMDCGNKTALTSERFQHADLVITVPSGTQTAGGFWFVNDLEEADDGSFIDPDDHIGGYATMQYPLNAATPAKTWQIDFSEANTSNGTRLRILLDVMPIIE